jgi:hypothetical protein
MVRWRVVFLAVLAWGQSLSAGATPLPRYGLFVYSSLCRDRMTDDLNGDRLVLVRLPFHDFGYMEGGDGGFTSADMQMLKIQNGMISFHYQDENETDKLKAVKTIRSSITAESVGLVSWEGKPFRLARLWKVDGKIPLCRAK